MTGAHTEPGSREIPFPCMVWVTASHSQDCTPGQIQDSCVDLYVTLSCRYFKGDIQIASVDGYGTDVYVYMQRLSHMAQENLPVYNAVSSAKLRNIATQVRDWTDLGGGSMQ